VNDGDEAADTNEGRLSVLETEPGVTEGKDMTGGEDRLLIGDLGC
jgi:hypothetical protein